jgi:hypothetical protein
MIDRLLPISGGADNLSLKSCGRNMHACINPPTICGVVKKVMA